MTLMIISLLAWLPLSLLLGVVVGKCIALGMGEPNAGPAPEQDANPRPQKFFRERVSA